MMNNFNKVVIIVDFLPGPSIKFINRIKGKKYKKKENGVYIC